MSSSGSGGGGSCWNWWRTASLDNPLRGLMAALGLRIGRNPWPFIIIPLLLLGALAYPFFTGMKNYRKLLMDKSDSLDLFTPTDSLSSKTRKQMSGLFPDGGYFAERTLVTPNLFIILVSAKDGRTLFRREIVQEYVKLREDLEQQVVVWENGTRQGYKKMCEADTYGIHCREDPFVSMWREGKFRLLSSLSYPSFNFSFRVGGGRLKTRKEYIGPLLGGVATDATSKIVYAKYVKMIFNLPPTPSPSLLREYGREWGKQVRAFHSPLLDTAYWSPQQYAKDMNLISRRTFKLLPILVGLLLLFALGSCCMADSVLSKPWLALCGVISSGAGIIVAYSLLFILHVDLIEIAMIVPFLVLSIGVDDMFVMLNVWRQQDLHLPVPTRLSLTLRDSGVSVTLTTLTDAGVFIVGIASVFPAVRTFCIYCSVSIIFVFLFHLSFLSACLALTGEREKAFRHCLTFRKIKDTNRVQCSCAECCEGETEGEGERRKRRATPCPVLFLQGPFTNFLSKSMTQAIVGGTYVVYLALATFCFCHRIQQGLQVSHLVPYDSDTFQYLQIYEKYFSQYSTAAEIVVTEPLEYSDEGIQRQLMNLVTSLEHTSFTMKTDFWLIDYLSLLRTRPSLDRTQFYQFLIDGFLRIDPFFRYAADVNLIEAIDGRYFINSTRFYVPLTNMGYRNRSIAMGVLMEVVDEYRLLGFPLLIHDVSFPLAEQYNAIVPGISLNVAVAGIGILLVALLFIPCVASCMAVGLSVVSMVLGVVGLLGAWDVHLDIISSITILLSIGFSVDFASHLSYHFYHAPYSKAKDKLSTAMAKVGYPIVQSSLSTLVGTLVVMGVGAYIAETFVKTVVLVMVVGAYHGLLVLPVLLSLLTDGLTKCRKNNNQHYAESKIQDIEQPAPSLIIPMLKDRKLPPLPISVDIPPKQQDRRVKKSSTERKKSKTEKIIRIEKHKASKTSSHKTKTPKGSESSSKHSVARPHSPRIAVVKPRQQPGDTTKRKNYKSFVHGKQQTVRVDTAWLDAWLHGDIACSTAKGKYCAYCNTRDTLASDVVKIKSLSHRSDETCTWQR